MVQHRLEHLRRGDGRLPALERGGDDALLDERHGNRPDLRAEVAAGNHDGVGRALMMASSSSSASAFSIFDHERPRPRLVEMLAQVAAVVRGAHERERDPVDAELEGKLEVLEVLVRQRRHGDADTRDVHSLLRADGAADDDGAARAPVHHFLDTQADEPVVDENVLSDLEPSVAARG